jgi:hypothetical protein
MGAWRHLATKVGTSKGWGKQWQTTPKNLPRIQRTRAIPVAWLGSGSCQTGPKGWILNNNNSTNAIFLSIRRKPYVYRKYLYYTTGNFTYMIFPFLKYYCFNLIRFDNRNPILCSQHLCANNLSNKKQLHHRMSSISHQIHWVHQPLYPMEIQCMLAKIQVSYVRFTPHIQTIQRQLYTEFTC